jgi:hypothetical protein
VRDHHTLDGMAMRLADVYDAALTERNRAEMLPSVRNQEL